MDEHLLPSNSTAFERAASLALNILPRVDTGVAALRTAKMVSIPDSVIPWLIYEYGLGPVSAYVADQRFLLSSGIAWQRVRGTPDAVHRALSWVGYEAQIEEAPTRRRRWNLFQLGLDRVRDNEAPDLENIDGVTSLSVAVRSHFWRGFNGYDVREHEWSRRRWSGARWSESSGVRLRVGGPKWSFGRPHEVIVPMLRDELIALGVWREEIGGEMGGWGLRNTNLYPFSGWDWGNFPWTTPGVTWASLDDEERIGLITASLAGRPVWITFRRGDGSIIGHRRARISVPVNFAPSGPYSHGGQALVPVAQGRRFFVEALTDFGNGAGEAAESVSLLFDATPVDTSRPGLQWAEPGDLSAGVSVAAVPVSIPLGATVRERVRYLLTF